ncbi:uncharacterized protein PHALS_06345 [Plasmopara halstedii]|uniref:Uncharacterized protein n=1 Tax=Plasmopara halstedii TaxID=4781 RepID=A0A0P1B1A9_PLAHL|nr:uncharacterized protein PHALS_06345 [Plasmopara halstedii]CEG48527.1 hypothetical protein PHALS_06345 [Plasmopara halstedii]|eukprot:XP_024584896.1 hypothetical protein PHALS_06345 [Plasmopara halstedii]
MTASNCAARIYTRNHFFNLLSRIAPLPIAHNPDIHLVTVTPHFCKPETAT